MNICYFILVHHKFGQALRLVDRLAGPHACFVIHVDKSVDEDSLLRLKSELDVDPPVTFAKRERGKWGSYGFARAIINCMEAAVQTGLNFDRCITMSGQDYPIASNADIVNFFRDNPKSEFIEAIPKDVVNDKFPPLAWTPFYRFRRYHFWVGNRRCSFPHPIKKPPDLPIFHGSAWWALTRECVEYLVVEIKKNKKMRRFFRTGFLVDEAYIQTFIMASPFANFVTGHNVTYTKWCKTDGPHPKILTSDDFYELANSQKLFARKFDMDLDPHILLRIEDHLN
jgi:hypothetical protein